MTTCPTCQADIGARTKCGSSYCEGYQDAVNEAATKEETRRAKPYWAARAICAILDEADEVIPDAECPLVMPPELWAWRFEHVYGKSRGVHVEDNVVSAVEQHICMQNDYRTSPFRRYVPEEDVAAAHEAGRLAAIRAEVVYARRAMDRDAAAHARNVASWNRAITSKNSDAEDRASLIGHSNGERRRLIRATKFLAATRRWLQETA